jgi:hypothetical protein
MGVMMIQEYAGEADPGRGPHGGSRTFSPGRGELGQAARARHPAQLEGMTGSRWLTLAAEMAGLTRDNSLPRVATRTLGADVESVRAARDFAVATLHRWGITERSQDIAIVVSELLTNALRHGLSEADESWPPETGDSRPRRPIRFGLLQPASYVLCAVADPSRAAPVLRAGDSFAETGRGLHIICALSDQWGFTPSDTGKVVWAMFCPRLARWRLVAPALLPHDPDQLCPKCTFCPAVTSLPRRVPARPGNSVKSRWYRGSSHRSPGSALRGRDLAHSGADTAEP